MPMSLGIYAQNYKPVTEENDRMRNVTGSGLGKLENWRATKKHDEAQTEGRKLSHLMLPPTRRSAEHCLI